MIYKRFIIAVVALFSFSLLSYADKGDGDEYHYELVSYEGGVAASPGWQIVKVWSYGRRERLTREYNMRNAIHGILFKGYPKMGANAGLKALVPEGYEAHKEFFDEFFQGKYLQYIQVTNNGMLDAGDVIKLDKRRYKIGMVVMVNVNGLRQYLEEKNIIKGLDFLF